MSIILFTHNKRIILYPIFQLCQNEGFAFDFWRTNSGNSSDNTIIAITSINYIGTMIYDSA